MYIYGKKKDTLAFTTSKEQFHQNGNIPISPVNLLYALVAKLNNAHFTVLPLSLF